MKIEEAQTKVDNYISQFKEGYFPPLSNLARLMEEIGELSREINHLHGPKKKKSTENQENKVREELGDIFFTLVVLANQLDVKLDEALKMVIDKYNGRDLSRWNLKDKESK